jgi:hypothetical protein
MAELAGRWRRVDGVAYETLDEEAVLLDLNAGTYYRLNAVAARAWSALETPRRLEEIAAELLPIFEVDEATLHSDLRTLLNDMRQSDLVSEEP